MVSLSAMRGRFEPEAKKSCRPLEVSATAVRVLGLIQHIHAYSTLLTPQLAMSSIYLTPKL